MNMNGDDGFITCPDCKTRHVPKDGALEGGVYISRCQVCSQSLMYKAESMMKGGVAITVNGKVYQVGTNYNARSLLVDFLRAEGISLGTKYMCREGGCGCCVVTVTIGKNKPLAINSCLCLLFACDGWSITTTEGLGTLDTGLSPIQDHLVTKNASQCGYCSPGFVMSMHGLLSKESKPTTEMIENVFDGNVCRCTGYRSIFTAMRESAITDIEDSGKNICPKDGQPCTNGTCSDTQPPLHVSNGGVTWYRPTSVTQLYDVMGKHGKDTVRLVHGNTGTGVLPSLSPDNYNVLIDLHGVTQFNEVTMTGSGLVIGSNITLSKMSEAFMHYSTIPCFAYLASLTDHIDHIANVPVRNAGTWAGNLMMRNVASFPSDIFTILEGVGARFTIGPVLKEHPVRDILNVDMGGHAIHSLRMPKMSPECVVKSYKIMMRSQNCQAYVNASFCHYIHKGAVVFRPSIVYGGISASFVHATKTEDYLVNQSLSDPAVLKKALAILETEIVPSSTPDHLGSVEYRKSLALSLFYKYVLSICADKVQPRYKSGGDNLSRPISHGVVTYDTNKKLWPLTEPVPKVDSYAQVTGQAVYIIDIPPSYGELHAAFVISTVGNADIDVIDASPALAIAGVVKFIDASSLPKQCVNDCSQPGNPVMEIFATKSVMFAGQSIGLVIARDEQTARRAAKLVKVTYKNVQTPILTIPQAKAAKSFFPKPCDDLVVGKAKAAILASPHVIKSVVSTYSQYHFHLENQIAICIPVEDGYIIHCSTQWMDMSHTITARVIGVPQHRYILLSN